jgi:hypothetical protein
MATFTIIFLNLLISVCPRHPRLGRDRFSIRRKTGPDDFVFVEDTQRDLDAPRAMRFCFHAYFGGKTSLCGLHVIVMATLVAAAILLFVTHL